MKLACIGTYSKANEKRIPLHPEHLALLPEALRARLRFDAGYGRHFGVSDTELAAQSAGVASRQELLSTSDAVLLLKPLREDLEQLKTGALLWGWPHSVQQAHVAEHAIAKGLTVIAMERMFPWGPNGERGQHLFYKNGELAGVSAVHHAFNLLGFDAHYGPPLRALVLGTGSSSRGAILALKARGISDIQVVEIRPEYKAKDHLHGCRYLTLTDEMLLSERAYAPTRPLKAALAEADIIVNAVFQNPNRPLHYLRKGEEDLFKQDALILDISCDEGMGFPFAVPTSFEKPILQMGHFHYYAVDHMPSLLWRSASWTVSEALLPYFEDIIQGSWRANTTLLKAVDFDRGVIADPAICEFQKRDPEYPHAFIGQ